MAGEASVGAPSDLGLDRGRVLRVEGDPVAGEGAVVRGVDDWDVDLGEALDERAVGFRVEFDQLADYMR